MNNMKANYEYIIQYNEMLENIFNGINTLNNELIDNLSFKGIWEADTPLKMTIVNDVIERTRGCVDEMAVYIFPKVNEYVNTAAQNYKVVDNNLIN